MTHPPSNPAPPNPAPRDWRNMEITIPDWVGWVLFVIGLFVLSHWVTTWNYHIPPARPHTGLTCCSNNPRNSLLLGIPLVIFISVVYIACTASIIASNTLCPQRISHAGLQALIWVQGLLRFSIPPASLGPGSTRGLPSQALAFVTLTRQQNLSPAQAIIKAMGPFPLRMRSLLLAGQSLHCLPAILDKTIDDLRKLIHTPAYMRLSLFSIMPLILVLPLIPFLTLAIFPKLIRTIQDFQTPLPPLAQLTLSFCQWFTAGPQALGYKPWPLLNLPGFVWLLAFLLLITSRSNPVTSALSYLRSRPFALKTPIVAPLIADHDWSSVYTLLSLSIRQGIPLPQAVRCANLPDLNHSIKSALSQWESLLTTGQPPAQAALAANLPPHLVATLSLAATNAGLAQSLAHLAHFHQARANWQTQKLAPLLPIAATLVSGLLVGLLVLGVADAGRAVFLSVQLATVISP